MTTYMIGYDLNKKGKNYDGLTEEIKRLFPTWWHHLGSTWLVVSSMTPTEIRDKLCPYLDSDDEILVSKVCAPAAWQGFNKEGADWLKEHLK